MKTLTKNGLLALMVAGPLALAGGDLTAQEAEAAPACVATVASAEILAGAAAQSVTLQLSESIGAVDAFSPSSDSGLRTATAAELPMTAMAAEGELAEPVTLAEDGMTATVWINTESAEPGTYSFELQGAEGSCTGELTIQPAG